MLVFFTTLYFVIFFICGMLGYIPVLFILLPLIMPIATGIPFMLFMTKVNKFGMVSLMGLVLGLLMFATGHTWVPILTGALCGVLADLIFKAGDYRKFKNIAAGCGVFSIWAIGAMLPMWIMKESYFAYIRSSMGDEYTNAIMAYTQNWILFALIGTAFLSGIIGAFLGRAVLKKHFIRAGIV